MDGVPNGKLRGLPQLQRLLEQPVAAALMERYSRAAVADSLRTVLSGVRVRLRTPGGMDETPDMAELLQLAEQALATRGLRRVINATGIILHTNLGRAPMAAAVCDAVAAMARGYCNLEYDLDAGSRGSRTQGVEPLLCALTGAEAAIAVNNCAAAMLLALSALAGSALPGGGEVIVSRGELVEIGGGFRIPDVIRQGGARLVEVGTTNKTRLADYARAITPATRVLLKVHQSNFQIVGFTESVSIAALAELAKQRGLLLVDDLGSGNVTDLRGLRRPSEATVQDSLAAGSDVVAFSGDKLLGGPQAGLLAGRAAAIDGMRRHPLMRALRPDKMTLAALEATLRLHRDGGWQAIPVLRAMGQSEAELRRRAEALAKLLGPWAHIQTTTGYAGGGSLPGEGIASAAVALALADPSADTLAARLRAHDPAVLGRIAHGCVVLDMLALTDAELPEVAHAIHAALAA